MQVWTQHQLHQTCTTFSLICLKASTFEAYGVSLAFLAIIKRDIAAAGYTESAPPNESQMDALHETSNDKTLSIIFLDSQFNNFGRDIEDTFTEGHDIYPSSVAEALE